MQAIHKYLPFLVSVILMCIVLYVIYPHYQYYIDPDGTAYLTIAKRYASGDVHNAINGYWSPWACWLTALVIKTGMQPIPASVVINALAATGFLYISQSLFVRFRIVPAMQWLLNITLTLFLCYAIFWQSFDDLWECFFLLSGLRIMLSGSFMKNPLLWALLGFTGALAYFAKAYSFPFFILNTICCVYFITKGNRQLWMQISLVAVVVMVLLSLPWIIILHGKYGIWTTSTAGALNMSWYLEGHPHWKEGIRLLIPPSYPDSPWYWEDPCYANGATPHFWNSWRLFGLQFLRIGLNILRFLWSIIQLSVFFPVILFMLLRFLSVRKTRGADPTFILALSALLFPLGYLLINFESRYLWYMLPLSMVTGGLFVQDYMTGQRRKGALRFIPLFFALSYLIYPAWGMIAMCNEGVNEYNIARKLSQLNVHGAFTAVTKQGPAAQRMERIAFFSGNQLFKIPAQDADPHALLQEMQRYGVTYFFTADTTKFTDEKGNPFPEITKGSIDGLHVYKVTHYISSP